MSKEFRKEIMKRTRLKNIAVKTGRTEDWKNYKIQWNVCSALNKKTQREFYSNLNVSLIDSNKIFRNTFKPLLSERNEFGGGKIILVENNEIISDDTLIANTFNNYFANITTTLHLKDWNTPLDAITRDTILPEFDLIANIKEKYQYHPSIVKIKEVMKD